MPSTSRLVIAIALLTATASSAPAGHRHRATTIELSALHGFMLGRRIEAPPWSFACLNDAGPRTCNQYIWVYGPIDAGEARP